MENQMEKKTNGFAIAGLVCALLVGPILGLIFSIIGLVKSKTTNSGKGLSIAGIIISIIRALFLVLIIFAFSAIFKTDEFKESYCANLTNYEEVCTKKDDGTYSCIFATCTEEQLTKREKAKEKMDEMKESIEIASKKELTDAIVNHLDKNAKIDRSNIKVTITKAVAESRYKTHTDMIVYNTDFTIECTNGKEDCIEIEDARAFPGIPFEYGESVSKQKLTFNNGKLTVGAGLVYSTLTKKFEWSTSPSEETENLPKVKEIE